MPFFMTLPKNCLNFKNQEFLNSNFFLKLSQNTRPANPTTRPETRNMADGYYPQLPDTRIPLPDPTRNPQIYYPTQHYFVGTNFLGEYLPS